MEKAARNLQADYERDGGEALERDLGPLVDKLLADKGIGSLAVETRCTVLLKCFNGLLDVMSTQVRQAGGDYRPDPVAERFPAWDAQIRRSEPTQPKGTH